ncbi:MAG: Hvo_1808 family surface protein [Haloarculaceae archaeon]
MNPRHVLLVAALVVSAGCSGALGIGTETPAPEPAATDASPTAAPTAATEAPAATSSPPPSPTAATDAGASDGTDTPTASAVRPPDPDADRLGWEGGLWYNETIAVDQSNGLNGTELDLVVNRSMARVERVRGLEFERSVPVEVISREELRERRADRYENLSDAARLHHNVKLEALFFVPEDEDAVAVQRSSAVGGVGGFYVPAEDRITVVSENTTSPKLDEITLAQELFHALQDQRFAGFNRQFNRSYANGTLTTEAHNTYDAVTEGDGNYVDYLYEQRCDAEWDCLLPGGSSGGGGDVHVGLNIMGFQPYSDGPPFVRSVRQREGWDGVDALYDDPPESTEQVIHPAKYGEDPPTDVTVTDRSAAAWRVLERADDGVGIGYVQTSARNETFGETGIFAMFIYPGYDSNGRTQLLSIRAFLNRAEDGEGLAAIDPLDYNGSYSTGWDGDTLVMYATDSSAATNETGYVWKTVWDSPADAREFRAGYEELLAYTTPSRSARTPTGCPPRAATRTPST